MKIVLFVGLAVLAVSTSGALAKKAKPPAATTTATSTPSLFQVSAADKALYKKNQRDSGVKAK